MIDMKERKYVKLRIDMYEDTKFKIIDTKPERDTIHYIWTRLLTLAAKVNLLGDLFMSRNIPHTIQTLAIELNRSEEQIKLAIGVFLELEMIELIDGRIYRVKNFAKHQNIKVEEKVKFEAKEEVNDKNIEADTKAVIANEFCDKEEKSDGAGEHNDKEFENNVGQNESSHIVNQDKRKVEINDSGINKGNNLNTEISEDISKNNITIPFEKKKNNKSEAKKKQEEVVNLTEEEGEEDEMFCFKEGEYIPGEGEKIIASWTF
jgi:phage replisome organizer, putative, N-terminal region